MKTADWLGISQTPRFIIGMLTFPHTNLLPADERRDIVMTLFLEGKHAIKPLGTFSSPSYGLLAWAFTYTDADRSVVQLMLHLQASGLVTHVLPDVDPQTEPNLPGHHYFERDGRAGWFHYQGQQMLVTLKNQGALTRYRLLVSDEVYRIITDFVMLGEMPVNMKEEKDGPK